MYSINRWIDRTLVNRPPWLLLSAVRMHLSLHHVWATSSCTSLPHQNLVGMHRHALILLLVLLRMLLGIMLLLWILILYSLVVIGHKLLVLGLLSYISIGMGRWGQLLLGKLLQAHLLLICLNLWWWHHLGHGHTAHVLGLLLWLFRLFERTRGTLER